MEQNPDEVYLAWMNWNILHLARQEMKVPWRAGKLSCDGPKDYSCETVEEAGLPDSQLISAWSKHLCNCQSFQIPLSISSCRAFIGVLLN